MSGPEQADRASIGETPTTERGNDNVDMPIVAETLQPKKSAPRVLQIKREEHPDWWGRSLAILALILSVAQLLWSFATARNEEARKDRIAYSASFQLGSTLADFEALKERLRREKKVKNGLLQISEDSYAQALFARMDGFLRQLQITEPITTYATGEINPDPRWLNNPNATQEMPSASPLLAERIATVQEVSVSRVFLLVFLLSKMKLLLNHSFFWPDDLKAPIESIPQQGVDKVAAYAVLIREAEPLAKRLGHAFNLPKTITRSNFESVKQSADAILKRLAAEYTFSRD